MRKPENTYPLLQRLSGIFMILTLLWLSVSSPFVYTSQQHQKAIAQKQKAEKIADNSNSNPLSNTNEEKTESGVTTLSEYLHAATSLPDQHATTLVTYYKCYPSDIYFAYHPELVSPPPEHSL